MYCGLCRELGKEYGLLARCMLNYDFVFLAMLLAPPEDKPAVETGRCPACPLRKKQMCVKEPGLTTAADLMVILSWWKLRDEVKDSGPIRGLPARFLSWLLKGNCRKAEQRQPGYAEAVRLGLEQLDRLEREQSPSIDRTADTFAKILSAAADRTEDEQRRRALEQLLYHVGRWIYLVDARDDLEEDGREKHYNPLVLRFPEPEGMDEYLHTTLLHSLNLARGAFELLPRTFWSDIVGNILYLGLPMVEKAVFTGRWKEIKKLTVRRA